MIEKIKYLQTLVKPFKTDRNNMKQNKAGHGWIRFIKLNGDYIDVPFPRGQGEEARKSAFDNAYRWTWSEISGGNKAEYDYYGIYSLDADGELWLDTKPCMLLYVPATQEKVEQYNKGIEDPKYSPIIDINGEPHFPTPCGIDEETNEIIAHESLQKYLEEIGYSSVYDILTYERLFP
jgi:hypothetical protein